MAGSDVSASVGQDRSAFVGPEHLLECAALSRGVFEKFLDRDWSIPAGDLTWDVRTTIAHACDALAWYCAHLAAQCPSRLMVDFAAHTGATNTELLDVYTAAAAMLAGVAASAPPGARGYHPHGMADASGFLALGGNEILVHTWDASRNLDPSYLPPDRLAEPVLRRSFPWVRLEVSPAQALLWANDRIDIEGHPRPGPGWMDHPAPLDEWDGTVPAAAGTSPVRYRFDEATRRWTPAF